VCTSTQAAQAAGHEHQTLQAAQDGLQTSINKKTSTSQAQHIYNLKA